MKLFVWHGEEHQVELAKIGDRYVGWYDDTVGTGVMIEGGSWIFEELVLHWTNEMLSRCH